MEDGKALSTEEINLIRQHRAEADFNRGFISGLETAAQRLQALANECSGGSGTGDTADTLRKAATEVLRTELPKN